MTLVEWKQGGKCQYVVCENDASLAQCLFSLMELGSQVKDTVVWTPDLIAELVRLGRAGHA